MSAARKLVEKITVETVPDILRLGFLPKHFDRAMMEVETRVYAGADYALEDYTGGMWIFREASNGAGYMAPGFLETGDKVHLGPVGEMGGSELLSADAVGLALTTMAVNHTLHRFFMAGRYETAKLLDSQWRLLMDVVHEHDEACALLAWLD